MDALVELPHVVGPHAGGVDHNVGPHFEPVGQAGAGHATVGVLE